MNIRLIYICICLFLFMGINRVFAQEILAKGVVINKTVKVRIALAEITNLRTHYAVGSDDMGFFQLKAIIGDTLLVSKRNFAEVKVVVVSEKDVLVYLSPTVTDIAAVTVSAQTKKSQLDEMRRDYRNKGVFYDGKPPLLAYIFHPISSIASIFSRDAKNARRFGRFYKNEMQQSSVDQFFSPTLVKENTGLEGKELEKFMFDYRPDYSLTTKWNVYDGIKYIKESYKKYSDTVKKN